MAVTIRKGEAISLSIIAGMFGAALIIMPHMPCRMVSHWGMDGKPNGYMDKGPAMLMLPCIALVVFLVFALISRIDPKGRMGEFTPAFDRFANIFLSLFAYIYALMILTGGGWHIDMNLAMAPFFTGLYLAIAVLVEQAKPNYFVGIRTPWTLENGEVWDKTHVMAGNIFRWCALAALGGVFFPKLMLLFAIVPSMAGTAYLLWYSYDMYQKVKKTPRSTDKLPRP